MFVPNSVMAFGSTYKMFTIRTSTVRRTYYRYLKVSRTHWKHLDNPNERCINEGTNTTFCIAEYIASKIGCSAQIQGITPKEFPPCKNATQWEAFINISTTLEQADATEVYEMTGCFSSCEKDKYDVALENWSEDTSYKNIHSQALFTFTIYERSYIEEEQYIIYDGNSFLADIGGFLGLVLGSSMLNIFDEVVGLLHGVNIEMV